jgi:hypothetical protein
LQSCSRARRDSNPRPLGPQPYRHGVRWCPSDRSGVRANGDCPSIVTFRDPSLPAVVARLWSGPWSGFTKEGRPSIPTSLPNSGARVATFENRTPGAEKAEYQTGYSRGGLRPPSARGRPRCSQAREKSREGGLCGVSNAGDLRQAGLRRPQVVAGELALDYAWWQPFIVRLDPELDLCLGAGIARTTG